jgi:1,4-alpha-glucan branching enzyme
MPFGAEVRAEGVRFRLWAPSARSVELCIDGREPIAIAPNADGWCEQAVEGVVHGARYRYRIDGDRMVPDPASRSQPDGVHAASEVIDPHRFDWGDNAWRGRSWNEAVIYELHVGTFTPEGSYRAATERLDHLAALGVTAIEIMPLNGSPGRWSWGYDGVAWFAPEARYGPPDDLKALVRAAHARGLMVLLDVVYNHFGPEGNYLHAYAQRFFMRERNTPWGGALAMSERAVRDFVIHNALYWLEEYRFDGLRLDAVDQIHDESVLVELARAVRTLGRSIHLVLEDHERRAHLLNAELYDGHWRDDLHHAALALASGATRGRYGLYADAPHERIGDVLTANGAVLYLQNHDRVGHRPRGARIHHEMPAAAWRAFTAIMLLSPATPLLFMGEEWAASTPFGFFCDLEPQLHDSVRRGRKQELVDIGEIDEATSILDPFAEGTFMSAKLCWDELDLPRHRAALQHCRELIATRAREIAPRLPATAGRAELIDGRLEVSWMLADGSRLALLAFLDAPTTPAERTGRTLYESDGQGPWWVGWYLH